MPPFLLNLLFSKWSWIALGFMVISLFAGCEHKRAEHWKEKHQSFVAHVKAIGEDQERATKRKIREDQLAKEKANEENRRSVATLNATISRMRAERARTGILPPIPPGSPSPESAAFNRVELERTLREFTESAAGLAEEGDRAIVDLNSAKKWALSIQP